MDEKLKHNRVIQQGYRVIFPIYYYFLGLVGALDVLIYREIFRDQVYRWLYDRIKPDTLLLDLGANIGDTAIYFAMHPDVKEVWAYEPHEKRYKTMESNLRQANFGKPIKTYNIAVEDLKPILDTAKKPVAIKCDIEGTEYKLFNNGVDLSKVYAIMMEYHNHPEPLLAVLNAKGFKASKRIRINEWPGYIMAERV